MNPGRSSLNPQQKLANRRREEWVWVRHADEDGRSVESRVRVLSWGPAGSPDVGLPLVSLPGHFARYMRAWRRAEPACDCLACQRAIQDGRETPHVTRQDNVRRDQRERSSGTRGNVRRARAAAGRR